MSFFRMRWGRVVIETASVVLSGFLAATSVANVGRQWWGDYGLEPQGVKDIAITREKLTIDLRPLVSLEPVRVEAEYFLHNSGTGKKLDLVFVSGTPEVTDFAVWLNDRQVPFNDRVGRQVEMREEWKPPRILPGIVWRQTYPVFPLTFTGATLQAFSLDLPGADSILRVHYRARPAGADEGYPTATWQFPYVLAPAREWKRFGRLDVTVHLPDGWEWTSQPALHLDGSLLRGSFEGLPADCLIVAARKPVGPELERAQNLYLALYTVEVILGGIVTWWLGRSCGRILGRRAPDRSWFGRRAELVIALLAVFCAVLWSAMTLAGGAFARERVYKCLEGPESPYFHEGFLLPGMGIFLLSFLLLPIGFAISWVSGESAYRRRSGRVIPATPWGTSSVEER